VADGDVVFQTSGTSNGTRRKIVWSAEELEMHNQIKRQVFQNEILVGRAVVDTGLGLAAHSTADVFRNLGVECLQISYDRPIAEHVAEIRHFKPITLYSMPSLVDALLRHGHLPATIRNIILIGEICTTEWRTRTSRRLGLETSALLDTYGCVETGLIAYRCHKCARFHFTNGVIAEAARPSEINTDWSDDTLTSAESVLVITSQYRSRMPVVRYVTYDIIRGLAKSACGGAQMIGFDAIVGRLGDEFKHGERISIYDIERAILGVIPDADYQVVQDVTGHCYIEVLSADVPEDRLGELREAVSGAAHPVAQMIEAGMLRSVDVRRVAAFRKTIGPATAKKSIRRAL
jgi:phenylacetate-coenzyme A ligase PaaK-like adenylate-forming protein